MPHVIYLHSSLTQARIVPRNVDESRRIYAFERVDVVLAMVTAGLVNMAMLFMAAKVFHSIADNKKNSPAIAEEARFYEADCHRREGNYTKAADTYSQLLNDFPSLTRRVLAKLRDLIEGLLAVRRDAGVNRGLHPLRSSVSVRGRISAIS